MEEYAEHKSGLLVPSELARETETWTRDEVRQLDRFVRAMDKKKLRVILVCQGKECRENPAKMELDRHLRGPVLRCNHKDRILDKGL